MDMRTSLSLLLDVSLINELLLFRRKKGFDIAVDTLHWRLVIGILVWQTELMG
jgi:hypothetical protein